LEQLLLGLPVPTLDADLIAPVRGLFVTIEKQKEHTKGFGSWQLRGCIGTLSETRTDTLGEFVAKSAFSDGRFDPMVQDELPLSRVKVSILVQFEPASSWDDWDVGTHGITLRLPAAKFGFSRSLSATYLPQVMPEQGWTKLEAVQSLSLKAGLNRALRDDELAHVQVERYQSSIATITPSEYDRIKKTCGGIPTTIRGGMAEAALSKAMGPAGRSPGE